MDEVPSQASAMMNTSGSSWLFGHSSFGSIHDAPLGPPPTNPGGNGVGGGHPGHPPSVSPFSSSPSGFDDRNSQLISFSQNVSPSDINMSFDTSKILSNYVTSSSPHQVVHQQQQQQQQHHHLVHTSTPTMTTLTSPASVGTSDDATTQQQLFQRHTMSEDPKMEYSPYSSQVMQAYTPDLGDQGSQGYPAAKEEPMYSTPNEADLSGGSVGTSSSMATLADYNQVLHKTSFLNKPNF